jgi:hypothetical protein
VGPKTQIPFLPSDLPVQIPDRTGAAQLTLFSLRRAVPLGDP